MKKGIRFILCCAAGLLLGACGANREFVLTGQIADCQSDALVFKCMDADICDTIPVAADGTFSYRRHIGTAAEGFVTELNESGFFAFIYVVDGTSTHITANAGDYDSTVITGDLEDAYRVGRRLGNMMRTYSEERRYDSFRQLEDDWQLLRDTLERESAAVGIKGFTKIERDNYASFHTSVVLDYANSLAAGGRAADSDADLNAYMERFDWNASGNFYVTQALRWYEACAGRTASPSYVNMIGMAAEKIKDEKTREKLILEMMSTYFATGADTHIDDVCAEALKYVKYDKAREWIENYNEKLKKVVPGIQALDCELERLDGSKLRLSDLYGEVLFLDIWATWCGPCCAEIPYLEKMVERFRGEKRVRFISITVDRDRKAWEKKLAEDKPEWEQYRCVDFCELYGIAGIPCFMMIDREGKLITMQAPRPSDDGCDEFIKSKL